MINIELYNSLHGSDDLGVVIRSHIIIEQSLNILIESKLKDITSYKKMELEFSQTVKLAIALGLNKDLESFLMCLGKLRNSFAHNIRPCISASDANNLYKAMNESEKETLQGSLANMRKLKEFSYIPKFSALSPKDKYIACVLVICSLLQKAIIKLKCT
jgi:hypothetical protein